jgi:hypothetical protein
MLPVKAAVGCTGGLYARNPGIGGTGVRAPLDRVAIDASFEYWVASEVCVVALTLSAAT